MAIESTCNHLHTMGSVAPAPLASPTKALAPQDSSQPGLQPPVRVPEQRASVRKQSAASKWLVENLLWVLPLCMLVCITMTASHMSSLRTKHSPDVTKEYNLRQETMLSLLVNGTNATCETEGIHYIPNIKMVCAEARVDVKVSLDTFLRNRVRWEFFMETLFFLFCCALPAWLVVKGLKEVWKYLRKLVQTEDYTSFVPLLGGLYLIGTWSYLVFFT